MRRRIFKCLVEEAAIWWWQPIIVLTFVELFKIRLRFYVTSGYILPFFLRPDSSFDHQLEDKSKIIKDHLRLLKIVSPLMDCKAAPDMHKNTNKDLNFYNLQKWMTNSSKWTKWKFNYHHLTAVPAEFGKNWVSLRTWN